MQSQHNALAIKTRKNILGTVTQACNPAMQKAEARRL